MENQDDSKKNQKSHKLLALILGIIFIIVVLVVVLIYAVRKNNDEEISDQNSSAVIEEESQQTRLEATVVYIEGTASKTSQSGTREELLLHSVVLPGESFTTSENTRLVLHLSNDDILRLDANARASFYQDGDNVRVVQEDGRAYHSVTPNTSHQYVVVLPTGELQALGTQFDVNVAEEQSTVLAFEHNVQYTFEAQQETIEEGTRAQIHRSGELEVAEIISDDVESSWIGFNVEQATKAQVSVASVQKLQEQVQTKEKEQETEKQVIPSAGALSLSGTATGEGVKLTWTTQLSAKNGFKVVKSLDENPVYPGDYYVYLNKSDARSYQWSITDGQTWHFRVCEYLEDGTCGAYSNDITVTAPKLEKKTEEKEQETEKDSNDISYATGVSLAGSRSGKTVNLSWNISGGDAPYGYKVVWSSDANPVYPGNTYKYLSNEAQKSVAVSLENEEAMHFRVCIYKNGSCGAYSNDLSL